MKVKVIEKRNGLPRQLDAIFFNEDGSVFFVRTVDPETGHDTQDHSEDEFDWTIDVEEEDIKKWKIVTKEDNDNVGQDNQSNVR